MEGIPNNKIEKTKEEQILELQKELEKAQYDLSEGEHHLRMAQDGGSSHDSYFAISGAMDSASRRITEITEQLDALRKG